MSSLKNIVKNIFKIFYIFRIKNNRLFCLSFDGGPLGYDGKAFIDWLYKNKPGKYNIIWGIKDKKYIIEYKNVKFIKTKSLRGIYYMLTSKVILCNINPPSYIPYRKNQVIINTWHGGGVIKKCGRHQPNFDEEQFNISTCFLSSSKIGTDMIIRESFLYRGEVLPFGVPRTDMFFNKEAISEKTKKIKKEYNIPNDYKILLYEPTFRGDFELKQNTIDFNGVINALNKKFNAKFILIYRLHPMIAEKYKINIDSAVDATLYPDNQDLLCAADVFVTDYSSGIWESCLKKIPIFIYADDIDTYDRLYFPYKTWPYSVAKNNDEFIKNINKFNEKAYLNKVGDYLKYLGCYEKGESCKQLYNYIEEKGFTSKK